jgi:hypothetical protein
VERIRSGAAVHSRPRPRAIAFQLGAGDVARLQTVFPTIEWVDRVGSVEQADFDVLVTGAGVPEETGDHLFVLARDQLGANGIEVLLGNVQHEKHGRLVASFGPQSITREFARPELPASIASLVDDVLDPGVAGRHPQRVLHFALYGTYGVFSVPAARTGLRPFLLGNDGTAVAGSFKRPSGAHCWALPDFVVDLLPWAVVAIREWKLIAPDRFPGEPDWRRAERWATPPELGLIREEARLRAELQQIQARFDTRFGELSNQLGRLRTEGDRTNRALLAVQGDDLVRAVLYALRGLGFEVQEMDNTGRSSKLEDLRVADSSKPGWMALAEVKGYARGGAKSGDLVQIGRFATLFAAEQKRPADAYWYVVNHSIAEDPSMRRPALAGSDDDLNVFAQGGGVVLDTRELFDLLFDVQVGATASQEARELLSGARGRFSYRRRT